MGHDSHDHSDSSGLKHAHARSASEAHVPGQHKAHAPTQVSTVVVTCSDSRELAADESGALIQAALERDGHLVVRRKVIRDEPIAIGAALEDASALGARAVIFNGGTGIGARDSTVETLRALFDKELPGFGEIFRALSFAEIGSAAMMSRATAGTVRGMVVFSVPGSPAAARLAMERLILPELGHAVRELTR